MFPYFMFGYAAAAMSFYHFLYKRAPVMVEEEAHECKIYNLFEAEEIRKAA